jgi:hypothetical protein
LDLEELKYFLYLTTLRGNRNIYESETQDDIRF